MSAGNGAKATAPAAPAKSADTPTSAAAPPKDEAKKAPGATPDASAAGVAPSAAPPSSAGAQDFDERVEKRVREILAKERESDERTAAERAAHEAWIGRHAPKLAGTEFGKILFAGANTDVERKQRQDAYLAWMKQYGYKLPDQGSSPEREGGIVPGSEHSPQASRVESAMQAAGELRPRRL